MSERDAMIRRTHWGYCDYCEAGEPSGCTCAEDRGDGVPNGSCCYCEISPCRCLQPDAAECTMSLADAAPIVYGTDR